MPDTNEYQNKVVVITAASSEFGSGTAIALAKCGTSVVLAAWSKVKTVYSMFVSRVDVYTKAALPDLSPAAQGQIGIVNAKHIWKLNRDLWVGMGLPVKQEMNFVSTGTKGKADPPWKYVEAFAGSDIEPNPPATNKLVEASERTFDRHVDELPPRALLDGTTAKVGQNEPEAALMTGGVGQVRRPAQEAARTDRRQAEGATGRRVGRERYSRLRVHT